MEITKEQFNEYVDIQNSGITNMCMISNVCDLTGLEKEEVLFIIKNYSDLKNKYK